MIGTSVDSHFIFTHHTRLADLAQKKNAIDLFDSAMEGLKVGVTMTR